ncbi:MAG: copper chaperone PCu(A)C [Thiohalomonadaceae bacterium]
MKRALVFTLALAFGGLAQAGAGDQVSVVDPYVRLSPPNAPATGAFMILKNNGDKPVRLVKASNPVSRITELHDHINENGVMKMRAIASVDIPAGGEAVLRPGGLHVMMIELQTPLREGDVIPLTLVFDDGSQLLVQAPVVRPTLRPARMSHR